MDHGRITSSSINPLATNAHLLNDVVLWFPRTSDLRSHEFMTLWMQYLSLPH